MAEVQKYYLPDFDIINSEKDFAFRIWHPDKTYLILGQSNKPETSLNLLSVEQDNVIVLKRPSGGETVVLTPNTLVIAVSFSVSELKNPKQYFQQINHAIILALEASGISGLSQKGISDIAIGEKKILGSSIYRRPGRVFYHAVLNVCETVDVIARYIKHPAKEPDYRKGRSHHEFVTSLKAEGCDLKPEGLLIELEKGLKKSFL